MAQEDITAKLNRIDRNLVTLIENIPLLKRAATDLELKQEIEDQKAKVRASAKRYIEKSNTRRKQKQLKR